jgi:hypothetical protein
MRIIIAILGVSTKLPHDEVSCQQKYGVNGTDLIRVKEVHP